MRGVLGYLGGVKIPVGDAKNVFEYALESGGVHVGCRCVVLVVAESLCLSIFIRASFHFLNSL